MLFKMLEDQEGFTLIEVLIVVVIIGFLVTTIGPDLFKRVSKAKQVVAQNQLDVLELALDNYRLDNGRYPTTEQGLEALIDKPATPEVDSTWAGPYLEKEEIPLDPWGREYHYRYPGEHNSHKYDLWSWGADNKEGGTGEDADVINW